MTPHTLPKLRASLRTQTLSEIRTRRVPRLGTLVCGVLVATFLTAFPASPVQAAGTEAKIKAAYLYNLLRRTTWPDSAFAGDDAPYTVAVLGKDSLEGLLDTVARKKKVNKRKISLKRLGSIAEYTPCHMLYVPGSPDADTRKSVLEKTADTSCLVVGETDGFGKEGATINFFPKPDGTIGYELNEVAEAGHNLKFEDQIRKVGTKVTP